jgi:hypothetical protein
MCPPPTPKCGGRPLRCLAMKPVLNALILAAAAAAAVTLVVTRRPSRPTPLEGAWEPAERPQA